MPLSHSLSQPVSSLMRYAEAVGPNDSLAKAAWLMRESSAGLVPIADAGKLVGVVSQRTLAAALENGLGTLSSVSSAMRDDPHTIPYFATGAEALRRFADLEGGTLVVVDGHEGYLGILTASDLYPRPEIPPVLPMIGGMATPFGVYLTAGGVRAGAGHLALIATGMTLSGLLILSTLAASWLAFSAGPALGLSLNRGLAAELLTLVLFFLGMRALPLSGTHASEHKVVHALENGEPLEPEVVQRMSRVHPRCGTNIAVAAALLLGLASWRWTPDEHLRMIVALLVTVFVWRPIGNAMQFLVTTKPPTERQLLNGIAAGRELIVNYQSGRRKRPHFGARIVASGMLHVMLGSMLMFGLASLIGKLFGVDLGI